MTPVSASPPYTHEQLDAMSDRQLDAAVAEVVMGWTIRWHGAFDISQVGWRYLPVDKRRNDDEQPLPNLSGAWTGFGQVVERMRVLGFGTNFDSFSPVAWDVSFTKNFRTSRSLHESLPRAAAIAAVIAVQEIEP